MLVAPIGVRERYMSKTMAKDPDLLDHYDFSGGVRGKYAKRASKSSHIVVLDPDVAEVFTSSDSVNETLRSLIPAIRRQAEINK